MLSATGVLTHLESYMVAEPVPATRDLREMLSNSVNEHVVNKVEVEKSRIIKKIAHRHETHHPGEDHSGNLETSKIPQNQYTDKVVDVSVAMQRQFPQIQTMHRKSWRMSLGWTSDTVNVHVDAVCKTLEMKVRSFAEDHGRKRCPGLGQRWV